MGNKERSSFSGTLGFVLAAAGSAVGLGNIWRFPYLAAKDNGGVFLLVYLLLVFTFGFALLTTEVAIGRKTQQGPLTAYCALDRRWKFLGWLAWLVPVIIMPYYCVIGGWVAKYLVTYMTGGAANAAADGYFISFITGQTEPVVFGLIYLALTAVVIFYGVENGIERLSKILMPVLLLLVIGISIYSLTITHTDADGTVRTGLQGLKIYLVPDFSGLTLKGFGLILMDAMGQLFFSISVAMGIMVTYGSYVKREVNLMSSINQIEFFDTLVALLAGMMIIPSVYAFSGTEGMSAGTGLMFISLPKVFDSMGAVGPVIGAFFFLMVSFAALTSSISIMEAIVSGLMDRFHFSRKKSSVIVVVYSLFGMLAVCLGYNVWYFELNLPNGSVGQILDVLDYLSNNILMPLVGLLSCILIGWVVKPKTVIDEVTRNGEAFGRRKLYVVMIKFIVPLLLALLLLQAFGII